MKYFGGCDVGSTYAKCVILDENGKISEEKVRENVSKTPTFQITKLKLPTTSEQITLL